MVINPFSAADVLAQLLQIFARIVLDNDVSVGESEHDSAVFAMMNMYTM